MEIQYKFALVLKLDSVPEIELPEGFDRIEKSHMTLIGGPALKQFKKELKVKMKTFLLRMQPLAELGAVKWSERMRKINDIDKFADNFSIATRDNVPVDKGNPDLGVETRRTLFVPISNQDAVREFVNELCEELGITNPEPDRFYHVSLANTHGGDAWKSVGDITASDI
jgi:hypothetical protein